MSGKKLISAETKVKLLAALVGGPLAIAFGAGVDSTAMLALLRMLGIRPDIITMADTGGEKKATYKHAAKINVLLKKWGWPEIDFCKKQTLPGTPYDDLYGNCISNETLPSLAFGFKSCSLKWKAGPQDNFIMGVKKGPNQRPAHPLWTSYQETGIRIRKLIGYDSGRADVKRSKGLSSQDKNFDYIYPLQIVGWHRIDCIEAIEAELGGEYVPEKSACFYCPASKLWELYWLAAKEPDLLEKALFMERNALTGRHSRFDEVEFGASWEHYVKNSDRFPSTTTCVGLGRSFSWNQWAVVNKVVDGDFNVKRDLAEKARFMAAADSLRGSDNALDRRSTGKVVYMRQVDLPFAA